MGQQLFVDELNLARKAADPRNPLTEIVVLCMTIECMLYCERENLWAYGGYQYNRPAVILEYTWPKLRGFIDILVSLIYTAHLDASGADKYWNLSGIWTELFLFRRRCELKDLALIDGYTEN